MSVNSCILQRIEHLGSCFYMIKVLPPSVSSVHIPGISLRRQTEPPVVSVLPVQHGQRDGSSRVLDERDHLGVRQVANGDAVDGHDRVSHVEETAAGGR